ncbi:MAG: molecular chaperone TorD family protein [Nitrospirae bacterium]|nr:molecular chaperone TorD family protein [Nitrospirota bacterium]
MPAQLILLYKIVSLGLAYPEGKNWLLIDDLLAAVAPFDGVTGEQFRSFRAFFAQNKHRLNEMESEYLRIFDIGGIISPYETEYLREKLSRKPFELADISGFYNAFGFDLSDDGSSREPADHIAVELEFMAIMELKEVYAMKTRREENRMIVRDARVDFLRAHLARWGFYYCRQIRELECDEFYKRLGGLLEAVLQLECDRYGLDAEFFKTAAGRRPPGGAGDDGFVCGPML